MARKTLEGTKYEHTLKYQVLLEAVEEGESRKVEVYLQELKIEELMDAKRFAPLHSAVQYRRVNVEEKLLEVGLTAYAETKDNVTPPQVAFEEKGIRLQE